METDAPPAADELAWSAKDSTGLPEKTISAFAASASAAAARGLPLSPRPRPSSIPCIRSSRAAAFRWNDTETNESDIFEYGSTARGRTPRRNWAAPRRSFTCSNTGTRKFADRSLPIYDQLDFLHDRRTLAAKGHKHLVTLRATASAKPAPWGRWTCVYFLLGYAARSGIWRARGLAALRDLVPVAGGACDQIGSAGRGRPATLWAGSISGRDTCEAGAARKKSRAG